MTWVKTMLTSFGASVLVVMKMYCENKVATYITNNPVFHERKHIKADCHYIRDMMQSGVVFTSHVLSVNQMVDKFT